MIGKFVWAAVPYAEGDGRYKIRPALVVAEAMIGGEKAYLLVPRYSATEKCKGENEVIMDRRDAIDVGIDKEGVLRFDRQYLVAIKAFDVKSELRGIDALSARKAEAIRRAARRIGCGI
jgi:DICT domain-containing protein